MGCAGRDRRHGIAGTRPGARADLARIVSAIPDGETVLIDGLVASQAAAQFCHTLAGYE